jgi:hypothetical protein
LEETAWTMLAVVYQAKLKKIVDTSLGEMARGEKHYSRSDFAEMQAQLYIDFARQLEMSQAEEDIDVVKAELQKHLPKIPPTSPQT